MQGVDWCQLKDDSFANLICKELKVLLKTQTKRVHKAVLTKQRSEALKPMILPQASKIQPDKIK